MITWSKLWFAYHTIEHLGSLFRTLHLLARLFIAETFMFAYRYCRPSLKAARWLWGRMKSRSIEVQTCLEGARQSKPAVIVKQIKGPLPAIPFYLAWDYFSAISGDALQWASRKAKILLTSKNFHEVCSAFRGGQPAEKEKQRCFVILDTHLYQPARLLM